MGTGAESEYRLAELDDRLRRRQGWLVTSGLIGLSAPFVVIVVTLTEREFRPGLSVAGVSVTAAAIALNRVVNHSMTPAQRSLMLASQRRRLDPLPHDYEDKTRRFELSPLIRRKSLQARNLLAIEVDEHRITIPVWILSSPPRSVKRDPTGTVRVAWSDIERLRVRSDLDGTSTYDISTTRPWFETAHHRWPPIRVRRAFITDEVALLDAVRSVGATPIELETSIVSDRRTPRDDRT